MKSSDSAGPVETGSGTLIDFACNICGRHNRVPAFRFDREVGSCSGCDSTVRTRAVVHMISQELFGRSIALPDFPVLKSIHAIGMSDSPDYAERLAAKFSYRNTFYHKEPHFDILQASESDLGAYDFVIASEVFEHVAPPVERAFESAFRVLKPHGLFFFTVPYTLESKSLEHFPELHDYSVAHLRDRYVLVNRTLEGSFQVFDDLIFHGGPGETLEMRRFNETELKSQFEKAGFSALEIYGANFAPSGILRTENWSLPMTARKQPFAFSHDTTLEMIEQFEYRTKLLQAEVRNLKGRVAEDERWAAWANGKIKEEEQELLDRTRWALDLEAQLKERTAWAQNLEKDVEHHLELAKRFQAESQERTQWAMQLESQAEILKNRLTALQRSRWMNLGRRLKLVKQ